MKELLMLGLLGVGGWFAYDAYQKSQDEKDDKLTLPTPPELDFDPELYNEMMKDFELPPAQKMNQAILWTRSAGAWR